ncbi:helix-turn-helix domain-containing protein [Sphingomonas sp.]|uniref:helix-turn-helix domain-containing protein n=1 Tax=Sphingomonas sp. TaxID=28214 RepID=UPI0035A87AED
MGAKVFDVASLASHWGCSSDTIYSLIHAGDLQAFKLGGKLLRIRESEVERYECRQNTASNDTAINSRSFGMKEVDATDIRLERLIERPQRPQLVHSGTSGR